MEEGWLGRGSTKELGLGEERQSILKWSDGGGGMEGSGKWGRESKSDK